MILLFLDCETTGLDPVIHVPWEVAAVRAEHTEDGRLVTLGTYHSFVSLSPEERRTADPVALDIGRWSRYGMHSPVEFPGDVARGIDNLCDDKPHLVGAVPSFDDRRVGDMMRRCGINPRWHYHLIDIEAIAVGYLVVPRRIGKSSSLVSWKSDEISRDLGVDPEKFDRHTAMSDVRWCMAQYAAIFGLEVVELS